MSRDFPAASLREACLRNPREMFEDQISVKQSLSSLSAVSLSSRVRATCHNTRRRYPRGVVGRVKFPTAKIWIFHRKISSWDFILCRLWSVHMKDSCSTRLRTLHALTCAWTTHTVWFLFLGADECAPPESDSDRALLSGTHAARHEGSIYFPGW